jgi:hypothetical protein
MFPLQVQVQTLPFAASFKYAVYTHGYVMVAGYPHFNALQRSTAGQNRHRSEASLANSRCPAKSSRLEISDAEILKDHHMMTAFVSDAVLQCLLLGLYEQGKLSQVIKDGDIPNVCSSLQRLDATALSRLNLLCILTLSCTRAAKMQSSSFCRGTKKEGGFWETTAHVFWQQAHCPCTAVLAICMRM